MRKLLLFLLFPTLTFAQTQGTQFDRIDSRGQVKTDVFLNRTTISMVGATPSVATGNVFLTNNPGVVTVTNFLGGADTQLITINCGDANTTIQNNANIVNASGADFTCGVNKTISYNYFSALGKWVQSGTGSAGGGGGSPGSPGNSLQKNNGSGGFSGSGISDDGSTITVTEPIAPTGNISLKGATSDPVQYVSPNGNDTNDGLSLGSAKLTVLAALKALPGGSSTTAGIGNILISGTVNASTVGGNGIWLMGSTDPNFASPPSGWLKWAPVSGSSLNFDCVAKNSSSAHGHNGTCGIHGGGTTDSVHPVFWASATNQSIAFNNIRFADFVNVYAKLGIDSNNNRTTAGGSVSGIYFNNVGWNHGACRAGGGPGVDIGSNSFWIYFRDGVGSGCVKQIFIVAASTGAARSSNVATITTTAASNIAVGDKVTIQNVSDASFNGTFTVATAPDTTHFTYANPGPANTVGGGQVLTPGAAAINIDSGATGSGSGLVFVETFNLNNGGIRLSPGLNGGSLYVRNLSYEGNFTDPDYPPVLITNEVDPLLVRVENVEVSDPIVSIPSVQFDNPGRDADAVIVSRVSSSRGPVHSLGGGPPIGGQTPLRAGQYGFSNGVVTGSGIDVLRRSFAPYAVPSTNLASSLPGTWSFSPGAGTVTNVGARDGTNNAGRVTSSSGSSFIAFTVLNSVAVTVGDYYIFGSWVRSNTANGYVGGVPPIKFALNNNGFGSGDTCYPGIAPTAISFPNIISAGDGLWQWFSGICKINSAPNTAGIFFGGIVDTTHTLDFYGPVLVKFATGTVSDNEAWEIANNLASFPSGVSAGTVSMLRGQSFAMSTGSNFLVNHTGTLTADRTDIWPDQSGTVAVTSEPFSSSPRAVPPVFFPGALTTTWTGASWTLDKAITVTRVQSAVKVVPAGCSTSAIVRVTDGSTPINLTINAATNDSGVITQSYAAGATLTVSVQTAASGCTTSPGDLNLSIQSRMN